MGIAMGEPALFARTGPLMWMGEPMADAFLRKELECEDVPPGLSCRDLCCPEREWNVGEVLLAAAPAEVP